MLTKVQVKTSQATGFISKENFKKNPYETVPRIHLKMYKPQGNKWSGKESAYL